MYQTFLITYVTKADQKIMPYKSPDSKQISKK